MIFMSDCVRRVNIFIVAVSIDRTLATPTATAALHLVGRWKPEFDSICLYARHQVQPDWGGRTLVNGHTEYLAVNAKTRWPTDSPVTKVYRLHRIVCVVIATRRLCCYCPRKQLPLAEPRLPWATLPRCHCPMCWQPEQEADPENRNQCLVRHRIHKAQTRLQLVSSIEPNLTPR